MVLNKKQLLPLLSLLSAFPALSTDMYLASLPTLAHQWHQPLSIINLTLAGFFFTYGLFLLVYGPLSDRYGRRKVLLIGITIYFVGCVMCAFAFGAVSMIVFRVIQAAGAASASAIAMAMTKDLYDGIERARVLANIAVIMAVAPMIGPIVGSYIMTYLDWPFVFVVQALLGAIAFAGVLFAPETLTESSSISPLAILKNYGQLLINGRFMAYTIMMALVIFPLFSFVGGASEIYIKIFDLNETQFGLFFGSNALAMMLGAIVCGKLIMRVPQDLLILTGYCGVFLGSVVLSQLGSLSPWHFALTMFFISFTCGISRPPNNNIVLSQVNRNVGTASSLLIFTNMMCAGAAMEVIALDWPDKIEFLAISGMICGAVVLLMWLIFRRRLD